MDVRSVSLHNVCSGRVSSENVVQWTRAKKEGLGKGLVPFSVMWYEGVTLRKIFENRCKYVQSGAFCGCNTHF